MTNDHYSDLIERYLGGEMSTDEAGQFEQMLQQDPMLTSEFKFQQDIVNGLKDCRKAELKMRLDNIDVSPGIFQTIAGNSVVQTTTGVLLTGVIAVGSYFWFTASEKIETVSFDIQSRVSELDASGYVDNSPAELPLIRLRSYQSAPESRNEEVVASDDRSELTEKKTNLTAPRVVVPELANSLTDVPTPEIEEMAPVLPETNRAVSQIEVENVVQSKRKFHYKFFNNKLFLYGDFKGIPYEILEINHKASKKLYLFYNDRYYRINEGVVKSSPLEELTNREQINELDILRENKTEE